MLDLEIRSPPVINLLILWRFLLNLTCLRGKWRSYKVLKSCQKRLKLSSTSSQANTFLHLRLPRSSLNLAILCLDISCLRACFLEECIEVRLGWIKVMKWSLMSLIITPELTVGFLELVKIWSISEIFSLKILVALFTVCINPCCNAHSKKLIAFAFRLRLIKFILESMKM